MIDSLTVLRGLAAWAVVLTHCLRLLESVSSVRIPTGLSWVDLGDFAVLVFFCLSGFALTRAHGNDKWDAVGWMRFLTRRVLRVYPAFLTSFAICLAAVAMLSHAQLLAPGTWIVDTNRVPSIGIALSYLSFTSNFLIAGDYVNTAYWSLPVEFQFYVLFPFFSILLGRSSLGLTCVALGLAGTARMFHLPGHTLDLAWVFAAGMIAGELTRRRAPISDLHLWLSAGVALILAGVLSNLSVAALRTLPGPLALYLGAAAIMLIWAISQVEMAGWCGQRTLRILKRQGEISYSIYLFHTPPLLVAWWVLQHFHLTSWTAIAVVYGISLPLTWISATLVYVTVERPGIDLGRQLTQRKWPIRNLTPGRT